MLRCIVVMGLGQSVLRRYLFVPPPFQFDPEVLSRVIPLRTKRGYSIPVVHLRSESSQFVVVYSHGNGEDIHSSLDWCMTLHRQLDIDIVVYDYCGYGMHKQDQDGVLPTESNVVADVVDVVTNVLKLDKPIILYGRSLGSAPTLAAAAIFTEKVVGVIVESGFTSPIKTQININLPFDVFRNDEIILHCPQPLCIIHGTQDNVVPFTHGERLAKLAPNLWRQRGNWINNGTHNDLDTTYGDEVVHIVRHFLHDLQQV